MSYILSCEKIVQLTVTVPVKLHGGSHDGEGNLVIFNEEQQLWIPVCSDSFYETAGRIVCQQIGFDDVYEGIGQKNRTRAFFHIFATNHKSILRQY